MDRQIPLEPKSCLGATCTSSGGQAMTKEGLLFKIAECVFFWALASNSKTEVGRMYLAFGTFSGVLICLIPNVFFENMWGEYCARRVVQGCWEELVQNGGFMGSELWVEQLCRSENLSSVFGKLKSLSTKAKSSRNICLVLLEFLEHRKTLENEAPDHISSKNKVPGSLTSAQSAVQARLIVFFCNTSRDACPERRCYVLERRM